MPVFVIDEYTRRLVRAKKLAKKLDYEYLRKLFEDNLPKKFEIYQDLHALIVVEGPAKETKSKVSSSSNGGCPKGKSKRVGK
jgi:endonuclease III-like uncharacterized protein